MRCPQEHLVIFASNQTFDYHCCSSRYSLGLSAQALILVQSTCSTSHCHRCSTAAAAATSTSGGGRRASAEDAVAACVRSELSAGYHDLAVLMCSQGWTLPRLSTLPHGVALPFREAFQRCRHSPPAGKHTTACTCTHLDPKYGPVFTIFLLIRKPCSNTSIKFGPSCSVVAQDSKVRCDAATQDT